MNQGRPTKKGCKIVFLNTLSAQNLAFIFFGKLIDVKYNVLDTSDIHCFHLSSMNCISNPQLTLLMSS